LIVACSNSEATSNAMVGGVALSDRHRCNDVTILTLIACLAVPLTMVRHQENGVMIPTLVASENKKNVQLESLDLQF
ncbi:Hypothetical predicted protein, partial [Olea europaea subsp. europaea]